MSVLSRRFLNRNTQDTEHVGAATLPYSDTHTIREVVDPLLNPSLVVEYITLNAAQIAEGRCRLQNDVARPDSVVVTVVGGIPQFHGQDFLVSESSPYYVYWDGLVLGDYIAEGEALMVQYETAGVPMGTPGKAPGDGGGFVAPTRIAEDHTVVASATLLVDTTADTVTVYLPEAAKAEGCTVIVKQVAGDNGVTISPFGTERLDGDADVLVLDVLYGSYTLICDGAEWFIV